jgi:hypothetical protein
VPLACPPHARHAPLGAARAGYYWNDHIFESVGVSFLSWGILAQVNQLMDNYFM